MLERFVLLSSPRTGSTLLAMALHAHPAVVMGGELFHPFEEERKRHAMNPQCALTVLDDYYHEGVDPVRFLEQQLYGRAYPPEKMAAGFKLFHFHLPDGPAAVFWSWLAAERDIRIIHLYRRRLLEAFVSLEIALRTQEWRRPASTGSAMPDLGPLTIDVDRFKRYADALASCVERMNATLKDHPMLTLEYQDDIVAQFEATVKKVEEFLGIASCPLPKKLQKQARSPLSEEIANFHEVHDALEGTRYEAYL
jgi:LPS sulfotransferase NodH